MILRKLKPEETHEPLFMFQDGSNIYLVSEKNYDKFVTARASAVLNQLADVILVKGLDNRYILAKSRHF